MTKPRWWIYGAHIYETYAQAYQLHLILRDSGHTISRVRHTAKGYEVQVYEH